MRARIFLSAMLAISCLSLISCNSKKKDKEEKEIETPKEFASETYVDTMHLHLQNFDKQIVCNGLLRAKAKSALNFTNGSMVTAIYVKNGQFVSKGTVVATTDNREKLREVEKAEHELERSRVELMDKVVSLGYGTNMDNVPDDVLKRAEVTSGYYSAKFALQSAKTALEECNLRAPFSGRIVNMEGRTYQRNDKLCTLVDDSQFEVEFKILEAELPNVKTGQKVKVSPFINEQSVYEGTVTQINPMVDDKGLIRITAKVDNVSGNTDMIDGLNVKVIVEEQVRQAFVVPKDAVVERDGYHVVFMYEDGKAVWTYVDVIHSNINSYAITGCLKKETAIREGDIVITSGNLNLADGSDVRLKQ